MENEVSNDQAIGLDQGGVARPLGTLGKGIRLTVFARATEAVETVLRSSFFFHHSFSPKEAEHSIRFQPRWHPSIYFLN